MKALLMGITLWVGATTVAMAASAPSPVSPFQGVFVALGIGGFDYQTYVKEEVYSSTDTSASSDKGDIGFAAEALLGYDYIWRQHFVTGIVANYMTNSAVIKSYEGQSNSSKNSVRNLYGVSVQLGFLPSDWAMIFVDIGPEMAKFNNSSNSSGSISTKNFHKLGLNIELGSKQSLYNTRWFVQEKVGYMNFGSRTLVHTNGYSSKIYPKALNGMVDVGYTFNV